MYLGDLLTNPTPSGIRPSNTSSRFGCARQPLSPPRWYGVPPAAARRHTGIDILAPFGAPILAPAHGLVHYAANSYGDGGIIVGLKHRMPYPGTKMLRILYSKHMHCSDLLVEAGDEVEQGQQIAKVGSTGNSNCPHNHTVLVWDEYFPSHLSSLYVDPEDLYYGSEDNMKMGDSGNRVRWMQERLNAHGATPPLATDGVFGNNSREALMVFQRGRNWLDPDGQCTPLDIEFLRRRPRVTKEA